MAPKEAEGIKTILDENWQISNVKTGGGEMTSPPV